MKDRVVSVVSRWLVLGIILCLIMPGVGCNFSSSASSRGEPGKGITGLTMDSADINPGVAITRSYTWEYGGEEWGWELQIPEELYHYYREMTRSVTNNYSVYVTHPWDDEYIGGLTEAIRSAAEEKEYSDYETIELAAAFVQNLPYNADSETTPYDEYPRYPVETLVDNGGDCEDTSILLASILDSMGYGVVLVNPLQHLAVGVLCVEGMPGRYYLHKEGSYYYLETTSPGWSIGELPHTYRFTPAHVYGIEPIPVLTHHWTTKIRDGSAILLDVTVENSGAIAADGICVWAGFEADEGQWLNSETSRYFDLPSGGSATVRLMLRIPPDKHTRLLVQIVDDGFAVVSSRSYWFDT